ncbi:hypothetical protein RJ640_020427 [Escallonia rubra]|uniref:Piriformospora indica-insensitive protein 2 n=1 Tax=Escallonia rubra TaxID=112253 RepID=A0AA88R8F9_9ASTE|nr:hypothetical protein RJ640_020427 [Escallonia rubra]
MAMKRSAIETVFICCVIFGMHILSSKGEADDSISPMERKEQEALYSAVQGFVGSWWNGSDLYPDPCGWTPIQGASCDLINGFWYVTTLNIGSVYDNSLKCTSNAEFKHQLFELRHLRSLSFSNCFLWPQKSPVSFPITSWNTLANTLESLEFRSNPGLIGTIPITFGHMKNLRSLVLQENGLLGQLPDNLGNLVNLRRLILTGNRFSGLIPSSLGGLTKLLIFDASRNFLSGTLPTSFGNLTSLLKLDLSNNFLGGVLPREVGLLKNLTLLDLGNNKFSGGLTLSIQEMLSLEEMVLPNNPIGGNLMNIQWENMQNLVYLDLSSMGLTESIPNSMTELKRVRFLGLDNNCLSGHIPLRFEAMPNISTLYLDGNYFTGKLEFSARFYDKMGCRFRASNNLDLCYLGNLIASRHVPVGVRQCQQEINNSSIESNIKMKDGEFSQKSRAIVSLGISRCSSVGFWWALVAKMLVLTHLCNMIF